jgi:hypothetical protein
MSENIIHAARTFEPNKEQLNIFGDGKAAEKICENISSFKGR